jgi:hypothetical protein
VNVIQQEVYCVWCGRPIDGRLIAWRTEPGQSRRDARPGCQWCGKPVLVAARTKLGEVRYAQQSVAGGLHDSIVGQDWTPEELEAIAAHLRSLHEADEPVFPDGSGTWSKDGTA